MGLKTLANQATVKVGKQLLVAKHHSPTALIGLGIVGVGTGVYLACKATLQLPEVLEDTEKLLVTLEADNVDSEGHTEEVKKKTFNLQVKTAIRIAKLYAPSALILTASVGAIAGSHIILRRRNAAATAALAIAHKSFNDYRARVRQELGDEKDLEFRFGTAEREIVEETETGPVVTTIKGLDQEKIKEQIERGETYARIFDEENDNWRVGPHENQYFIRMVLQHSRDALQMNGYLFLSDVYDMLGFKRTQASNQVGWVLKKEINPVTGKQNDGYVDFGLWSQGMHAGKEWVNGNPEAILLDFNVDGPISHVLDEM